MQWNKEKSAKAQAVMAMISENIEHGLVNELAEKALANLNEKQVYILDKWSMHWRAAMHANDYIKMDRAGERMYAYLQALADMDIIEDLQVRETVEYFKGKREEI